MSTDHPTIQHTSQARPPAHAPRATCPNLALSDDHHSIALYPRSDHICRSPGARPPSIEWQSSHCLCANHHQCRHYHPVGVPPLATRDGRSTAASAALSSHGDEMAKRLRPPSIRHAASALVALIALVAVGFALMMAREDSGGGVPRAVMAIDESTATASATSHAALDPETELVDGDPGAGISATPIATATRSASTITTATASPTLTPTLTPTNAPTATPTVTPTPTETPAPPDPTPTETPLPPPPPTEAIVEPEPPTPTPTPIEVFVPPTPTEPPPPPTATPTIPAPPTATPTVPPDWSTPPGVPTPER